MSKIKPTKELKNPTFEERENQLFLEKVLIPNIPFDLPQTAAAKFFFETVISGCLNNPYYRFAYDETNRTIQLERVDGYNIKPHEKYAGDQTYKSEELMITVRDIYERLSQAIHKYCLERDKTIPPPPSFIEYKMEEASRELPAHILETREALQKLIGWSQLRRLNPETLKTDDLEVHLTKLKRHYNNFFGQKSEKGHCPNFQNWLEEINPALIEIIIRKFEARRPDKNQ